MSEINWKLEKRKIKELKNHPKNPRKMSKHDAEHLQKSLQKFGLIDKPIINTDNKIIGGHQRVSVLKKMGIEEIECYVPDLYLSDGEVDELNIRLNRAHGDFDWDILANDFESADLLEWGFLIDELVGDEPEEIGSKEEEPKDKKTKCPNCGHEF
jgi:ParB-like chromosome segregation protein Spo0J